MDIPFIATEKSACRSKTPYDTDGEKIRNYEIPRRWEERDQSGKTKERPMDCFSQKDIENNQEYAMPEVVSCREQEKRCTSKYDDVECQSSIPPSVSHSCVTAPKIPRDVVEPDWQCSKSDAKGGREEMDVPVNEGQQNIIAESDIVECVCENEATNAEFEFVQEFTEEAKRNVEPIEVARNPFSHPWEDSNLVLIVNGVKFYVHRFMLTLSSPVFSTMLKSESKETSNAEITLPEKDADDILNLLKQLYPQERDEITMDNVERLLKLAEEYQIKTVLDLCATRLRNEPKTKDNAMEILLLVQKYSLSYVGDDCRNVLAKLSLQRLEKYREFADLNGENLRAILLPRMRRLEKTVKELSPQVSGMVAFAMWSWSQGRKDMMWCPVHIPNGKPCISIRECLQTCPVCKKVIESLASKTIIERQHRASKVFLKSITSSSEYVYTDFKDDHFESNFNSVMKNMFDLVD